MAVVYVFGGFIALAALGLYVYHPLEVMVGDVQEKLAHRRELRVLRK